MRKRRLLSFTAIVVFTFCAFTVAARATAFVKVHDPVTTTSTTVPLIPMPAEVSQGSGKVRFGAHTPIVTMAGNPAAQRASDYLASELRRLKAGWAPILRCAPASMVSIRLKLDPEAPVKYADGYSLTVDHRGITVRASSAAGLFYGAVSTWQLLTANPKADAVTLPYMTIRDWPRFKWRGLMVDSARHMQSVATIKRVLNQMALHKLNVFHWHLTDDQGWRLPVDGLPKLTSIGAWRSPPGAGTHGEPRRYGGFYTHQQIRDIVAYAKARHITVVPEIEMPGHAQAAVASYPGVIGVTDKKPKVSVDWGVNPYLYNVTDRSFAFIDQVLHQVMKLFPSRYIHVGGDEAIKNQWQHSVAVQAKLKKLGINNTNALQGWFINRVGRYLSKHGRRLIGWDGILEGGLPANAAVMSWRGVAGAVKAAKLGHEVVLAPDGPLYFDHLQSKNADEPSGQLGLSTLAKVYAFKPEASLDTAQDKYVLGVEATLFSEYMPAQWNVEHALFPRLDALSEMAWSPASKRNWKSFLARLPAQMARYKALDIHAARSAFEAQIKLPDGRAKALATGRAKVILRNQVSFGTTHYTTDGSAPSRQSPVYAHPFPVKLPATVKAAVYADDGIQIASPHTRVLDRAHLLTRSSNQLKPCGDGHFGSRVPLLPDLGGKNVPDYNVDLFHSCWIYPKARLNRVRGITVDAARLARNFALAGAQSQVVSYPRLRPAGSLEVKLDSCKGRTIARLPLPGGHTLGARFTLHGKLPAMTGIHDLCLRFTADIHGPLYAIGEVHLLSHAAKANAAPHT